MSDQWGTREYAPDRQPPSSSRRERVPGTAAAQQAYITLAAVSLSAASMSAIFQWVGHLEIGRGVYAILAGLLAIGGHGWTVCQAEARVRRDLGGKVAELTTVLSELRDEVARQGVAHLHPSPDRQTGVRHLSAAVGGQGRPAPPPRVGLDPETIAAARSLARQIIDGPTGDTPVRRDPE